MKNALFASDLRQNQKRKPWNHCGSKVFADVYKRQTLYRIVSDYKFIHEIKRDFLKNEFYNIVVGEDYDFMKEEHHV